VGFSESVRGTNGIRGRGVGFLEAFDAGK